MVVLDTHTWLWWVSAPNLLSRRARAEIDKSLRLGVSAISCWEVVLLTEKGRVTLDRSLLDWLEHALAIKRVELLPVTPAVAVFSSTLGLHGDPGDRLIAATAHVHSAPLITKDARLRGNKMLHTIW